jgi:hypothetical protein
MDSTIPRVVAAVTGSTGVDDDNESYDFTISVAGAEDAGGPAEKLAKKKAVDPKDALPDGIKDLKEDDYERFVFEEKLPQSTARRGRKRKAQEDEDSDEEQQQAPSQKPELVLSEIVRSDEGPNVLTKTFNQNQLRALASVFGVTRACHKTKWQLLVEISRTIRKRRVLDGKFDALLGRGTVPSPASSVVVVDDTASVVTEAASKATASDRERRLIWNAIARASNVLFSEPLLPQFLTLNDRRDHHIQDTGIGTKAERFWASVAKEFKAKPDDASDDRFGDLDLTLVAGNPDIQERFTSAKIDPSQYPDLDNYPKKLEEWTKDLISIRSLIKGPTMMGKSGTHDSDIYNFVKAGAKKKHKLRVMGLFPIYYFMLKADQCQDFDTKFMPFAVEGIAGSSLTVASGASDSKPRARRSPTGYQDHSVLADAVTRLADCEVRRLEAAERLALMEQFSKVTQLMTTCEEGTEEFDTFKLMRRDIHLKLRGSMPPSEAPAGASTAIRGMAAVASAQPTTTRGMAAVASAQPTTTRGMAAEASAQPPADAEPAAHLNRAEGGSEGSGESSAESTESEDDD